MAAEKLTQLTATGVPQPTDKMYIVRPSAGAAGSLGIVNNDLFSIITQNIADKAVRFEQAASPPVSAPGGASIAVLPNTPDRPRLCVSDDQIAYVTIGNVMGPRMFGSAPTSNGVAYLQNLNGQDGASAMAVITATDTRSFVYPPNSRQTFAPGATVAGVNVGAVSPDPTTPVNGDIWYNSATNSLMARINGVNVNLSQPPGVPVALPSDFTPAANAGGNVETNLRSRLFGNTIASTGDWIRITFGGTLTATGTLRLTVGSGNFLITGALATSGSWRAVVEIGLVDAGTGSIQVSVQLINGTNAFCNNSQGAINLVNWGVNLFGNGPNAGDAICNMMIVELIKF